MAPTIFENVTENVELDGLGELFAGKAFFVAQRVPIRNHILDDIRANGGEIVKVEKRADYIIVDHLRKDCPPGSISYEFIEKSIKRGELEDPEDHQCGPRPGEVREVGAINRPAKGGRLAYTAEDDRILYKWVRDCKAAGSSEKGNVIYQQLEAKHSHHTWQSWRDRYVKQLINRPPSAFNIPDNAPPSPPSDSPAEPVRSMPPPSKRSKQPTSMEKARKPKSVEIKEEYTLDDLAAMFSSDDWEELYAFADMIEDMVGEERYDAAWAEWAEHQGDQTVEQWRQYYEKVVRPQWLRDPAWKRKQIREKREKKHDDDDLSQSQPSGQQQNEDPDDGEDADAQAVTIKKEKTLEVRKPSEAEDAHFEELLERKRSDPAASAYTFFAREKKWATWNSKPGLDYAQLHTLLLSQWDSLSTKEKRPYVAKADQLKKHNADRAAKLATDLKMLSSSTAQHEPPEHLVKMTDRLVKRIRGEDAPDEDDEQGGPLPPTKRRKSASLTPTLDDRASRRLELPEPEERTIEISSAESTSTSLTDVLDQQSQEQIRQELLQTLHIQESASDQNEDLPTESIETDDLSDIVPLSPPPKDYDQESDDHLPSNTPTPRASRQVESKFDTQAILSSPSQDIFGQLPARRPSPPQHPESDASTTQSLEEFRRSLNEEDSTQIPFSQNPTHLRPISLSPTPSFSSSVDSVSSGDPDVPLEINEIGDFFDEQIANGLDNHSVAKALRRTRLRPTLATRVLDAWKMGNPLPNERGIWSIEDDEDVESGDGVALARLERKHTVDGWGGITERLIFLEANRSR